MLLAQLERNLGNLQQRVEGNEEREQQTPLIIKFGYVSA